MDITMKENTFNSKAASELLTGVVQEYTKNNKVRIPSYLAILKDIQLTKVLSRRFL